LLTVCLLAHCLLTHRWFDAGDYSKYVLNTAPTLWRLLNGYEMFPAKFSSDYWNIPESGNSVPDLLDEAQWELTWLEKMQARDGGVYDKVGACSRLRAVSSYVMLHVMHVMYMQSVGDVYMCCLSVYMCVYICV
jgi:hypothetical protein